MSNPQPVREAVACTTVGQWTISKRIGTGQHPQDPSEPSKSMAKNGRAMPFRQTRYELGSCRNAQIIAVEGVSPHQWLPLDLRHDGDPLGPGRTILKTG